MKSPANAMRLDPQRPWPGLRSFDEADSAFFFGRHREASELRDLVERSPAVVLYGQSGLGKTSILRAGLFPLLKVVDLLPIWIRFDHSDAAPPLTRQLLETLHEACTNAGIEAPKPMPDESLWSYFHRADADFWGPRNRLYRPLIVLDQFEELFTLGRRNEIVTRRSEQFESELEALVEQRPPPDIRELVERDPGRAADYTDADRDNVRLLVSLREDFLPHLDAWSSRMPTLLARRYRLEPMTRDQALAVVLDGGAALVDEPVAREIVEFVSGSSGERRVEPAILSVVCDELNTRRLNGGLDRITLSLLSGERSRIIADFYERSMAGVPEPVRDWVEDELLTASGHRDRAALEDARRAGIDPLHIEMLVDRRVLHSDERNRVIWIEFTHDLLTTPAMASRTEREQRRAAAEVERRSQEVAKQLKRSRRLAATFGVMAACMAGVTIWSITLRREATTQRETAEAQTQAANLERARALDQSARADEASRIAQRRESEAEQSAEAARVAAAKADSEASRAVQAEAQARRNLSQAEATAVRMVQQAHATIERQWLDPSPDAVRIVEVTLAGVEPLARQFTDVPALADARRRARALAALVHAEREDVAQCSGLVREASPAAATTTPHGESGLAPMSELAAGHCLLLRGRLQQAESSFGRVVDAIRGMKERTATDHRMWIGAILGLASAAQARYSDSDAARHLAAAREWLQRAQSESALSADEILKWQLALLASEARGSDNPWRARELHGRLAREAGSFTPARRESLWWRMQRTTYDVRRAWALKGSGRLAESESLTVEVIEALDRMIGIDPTNARLQLLRNDAARLRAEILQVWGRKNQAHALILDIETRVNEIIRRQPEHARARHQQGVLAWLLSQLADVSDAEREAKLASAVERFRSVTHDLPELREGLRSQAIATHELGKAIQRRAVKASAVEQARLRDLASDRYTQAMDTLSRLSYARSRRDIADVGASIEFSRGDLALERGQPIEALDRFREATRWRRAVPLDPTDAADRVADSAIYDMHVARALRVAGRVADADAVDRSTLAELAAARKAAPANFGLAMQVSWVHRMAAADHLEQGRIEQALGSQLAGAAIVADELRRDPLSKAAEEALGEIHKYVNESIEPVVTKAARPEWNALLEELRSRSSPKEAVPLPENRPSARMPRLAGDWEHMDVPRLAQFGPTLDPHLATLRAKGWSALAARRLKLPFYQSASLLEIDVRKGTSELGVASFLIDAEGVAAPLTGVSTPVHQYNARQELLLRTEEQARQYLRFFVGVLDSDDGAFRLVGDANDLMWIPGTSQAVSTPVLGQLEPLRLAADDDGTWTAQGTMQWGTEMFLVKLTLGRSGRVDMNRDNGRRLKLPLETTRYTPDGVRIRDASLALDVVADRALTSGDRPAAAAAIQAGIEARRSWMSDEMLRKALPGHYLDLSWNRLLTREPRAALEAAQTGLALTPDNLTLQTNRAHALLLLGRESEALAAYRRHIGQRVGGSGSRLWEEEILNDLNELEKGGLKDPRFDAVRSMMRAARR